MRITHQMLSRNYLKRMNTNLSNLTKSNDKLASGRAFTKGYENVGDASKALRMRKLIANNERYQTTIRDVKGRAAAAEDSLRTVNDLLIRSEDLMVEALNGTLGEDERKKIANELERYQEEIFKIMNNTYADKYLFNAAGAEKATPPFGKDGNGNLTYNDYIVNDIVEVDGILYDRDPASGGQPLKYNEKNYVDIGFGYKVYDWTAGMLDGKVDPNTAFQDTYSGAEAFGFGMASNGNAPLNAYNLFGDMVKNLNANNMELLRHDLDALPETMEHLLTSITEIGARGKMLDDTAATLENEYINLIDRQRELEGVDVSKEIIFNKDYEMSWLITLQLGSKILPQTLFDFIR